MSTFEDSNASQNAKQLTPDSVNIVTLDVVAVDGSSTAEQAAAVTQERYVNSGIKDVSLKDSEIGNYKGKQVTVKVPDGRILIVNYIEYNNNVYYISQEGLPKYQNELTKVVNTWRPDK